MSLYYEPCRHDKLLYVYYSYSDSKVPLTLASAAATQGFPYLTVPGSRVRYTTAPGQELVS